MADFDEHGGSTDGGSNGYHDDPSSSPSGSSTTADSSLATQIVDDIPEIELIIKVSEYLSFFSLFCTIYLRTFKRLFAPILISILSFLFLPPDDFVVHLSIILFLCVCACFLNST